VQKALCSAPVLGILDFSKPFVNETDASQTGVGADVLLQSGHPLAYVSKPLGVKTQGLSLEEGLLKYKNKVWVGRNTFMQLKLIQILHNTSWHTVSLILLRVCLPHTVTIVSSSWWIFSPNTATS